VTTHPSTRVTAEARNVKSVTCRTADSDTDEIATAFIIYAE